MPNTGNLKRGNPKRSKTTTHGRKARTVRAATANTSERVTGLAQETARAGFDAASERTRQLTDQASQIFVFSGEQGEEIARRSAQSIEAVTRGLQELSRELIKLTQERIQRNVDALGALSRCRSIPEFVTLQNDLWRDNLQHSLESTRRVAELSSRMANEATQTLARH